MLCLPESHWHLYRPRNLYLSKTHKIFLALTLHLKTQSACPLLYHGGSVFFKNMGVMKCREGNEGTR